MGYDMEGIKSEARYCIEGKLWRCFLLTLAMSGIYFLTERSLAFMRWPLLRIGAMLVGWVLNYGMLFFYLNIADGREEKISDLFEGLNNIAGVIGLQLLMNLIIYLFSMLLIVPGIIRAYSYSMAIFIKIENPDMSASDVLKASSQMMNGHKMELFMLQLSFIGWIILMIITVGLAGIYVVPYMQTSIARFYRHIQ